ncbi:MAG: glycosyltransferase [bacterium]
MISFIIIGKNESSTLEYCFNSVFKTIKKYNITRCDIWYIDSCSTDNSVQIASKYEEIQIIALSESCSPAIARNIGAKNAKGEILFFIDGDTAINPDFVDFQELLIKNQVFIYGQYVNLSPKNISEDYNLSNISRKQGITYGIFIVEKQLFNHIGGFKEKYKKPGGEDIDFYLRLKRKGYNPTIIEETIAFHFSFDYLSSKRMWQNLLDHSQLYARSVLYRDHITSKNIWNLILRRETTLISLITGISLSLFFSSIYPILIFVVVLFFRIIFQKNLSLKNFLLRIIYYPIRDVYTFLGFFLFWPRKPKHVKWKKIKS